MPARPGMAKGEPAVGDRSEFAPAVIEGSGLLPCSPDMDAPDALLQTLASEAMDLATAVSRVRALVAEGAVRTPNARFLAAAVLVRSQDVATVAEAHEFALMAMQGHRPARALAARSFDKLRVLRGEIQKFGTQRASDGGELPCDPATTDSERAKWDLPTLATLRRGGSV